MWGGPLHNPWYIQRILNMLPSLDMKIYATIPRIEGMLTLARDETILDEPASEPKSDSAESAEIQTTRPPLEAFPSLPASNRAHHPFFVIPSHLASIIHCTSPSDAAMRGALMHLGYRTSRSHTKPGSIVTDAPWNVLWEIMRYVNLPANQRLAEYGNTDCFDFTESMQGRRRRSKTVVSGRARLVGELYQNLERIGTSVRPRRV